MAKHTQPPTGRPSAKVDWSRFTDGQWWALEKDSDFRQDPTRASRAARQWASVNGYRCSAIVDGDTGIKVQFEKVVL